MAVSGLGSKLKSPPRFPSRDPYPRDRVVYSEPVPVQLIGLERQYKEICFRNPFREKCNFESYIEPNETFPVEAAPHCVGLKEGIAVVTGTERLFFLLGLLDPKECKGVVGRDINPAVSGYIHFNLLLLRLSPTREEYAKLSDKPVNDQEYGLRIKRIASRLEKSKLPDIVKNFYKTHLFTCGAIYLKAAKQWRNQESFDGCNYYKCDTLFKKIKSYADEGNIITTTGPINMLLFDNVSLIDTSNILQYSFLNLEVEGHPRVIWTCSVQQRWQYKSYTHEPLSDEESLEFDAILDVIKSSTEVVKRSAFADPYAIFLLQASGGVNANIGEASLGSIYSKKTLEFLRKYKEDNILTIPELGHFNVAHISIKRLNLLSHLEITPLCSENRVTIIRKLVEKWELLDPEIYFAFSHLEGWTEMLEDYLHLRGDEFGEFLDYVKSAGFFDEFTKIFGEDRFTRLMFSVNQGAVGNRYG